MGHVEVNAVSFALPDGRPLLDGVGFRVGDGTTSALVGPNGTGKTTLLRIIAGDLDPHGGAVTRSGGLGVMRQFVGSVRDSSTVRDLLVSVAPARVRAADEAPVAPVSHTGTARLGARVRPGWFVLTHDHPELAGRTLLEVLHRGTAHRDGLPREPASRALDRYESVGAALGGGAGDRARGVRGHRPRGDARPVVRALVRPVPGVRRGRVARTVPGGPRSRRG